MAANPPRKARPPRSSHKSDHIQIGNKLTANVVSFFCGAAA
ncbi:hypothetical protein GGR96_002075 [Thalassospira tepidiphila]|uniref:Uncharacterized protein n=1 Tax=Thalassospira tepidiphila TaxID=393657 RepID=A0ABX0X0D1_9PROT|nr:hypothetical protein [Thalassospira tepidiphila]